MKYPSGHPLNLIAKLLLNSLYGKFGMKPQKSLIEMYDINNANDKQRLQSVLDNYGESLQDYIKLDNHYIIIRHDLANYQYDESKDLYHGLDVNIGIAAAITAGGRMWMTQFKNERGIKLYYSDTDSIIINTQLPDQWVGNNLGQFKLEYEIDRAVFIAPKVYGFITSDGDEIIKVKGVGKEALQDIHIKDLELLLLKDSTLELNQTKWFKKVFEGNISILDVAYQLKVTSNKRAPIYHEYPIDNDLLEIFSDTKPYNYKDL